MPTINRMGATRIVFIFKRFVVKIPNTRSWKLFLHGLIANINEKTFGDLYGTPGIPKIYYGNCLGLLLVERRVKAIRHRGLFWVELARLVATSELHPDFWNDDAKPENFGFDRGMNFTKIDLG